MNQLNVTEYAAVGREGTGGVIPALSSYNVEINIEPICSKPFNERTLAIRVIADVDCRLDIGRDPKAGPESTLLTAGTVEWFHVQQSKPFKLSVVQS